MAALTRHDPVGANEACSRLIVRRHVKSGGFESRLRVTVDAGLHVGPLHAPGHRLKRPNVDVAVTVGARVMGDRFVLLAVALRWLVAALAANDAMSPAQRKTRFAVIEPAACVLGLPICGAVAVLASVAEGASMYVGVATHTGSSKPFKGPKAGACGGDPHGAVIPYLAPRFVTHLAGDLPMFVG